MSRQLAKARTTKRLRSEALERHVKQAFSNRKPAVFIAGQTIHINADRKS